MSIYDANGNSINAWFDIEGNKRGTYFDIEGNEYENRPLVAIGNLVAMSFNAQKWQGINDSYKRLDTILSTYTPDLVCFQEYKDSSTAAGKEISKIVSEKFGTLKRVEYDETPGTYIATGSPSYELIGAEEIYFTTGKEYQKMYFAFNGKTIALFNVHLTWDSLTSEKRLTEAQELLAAVSNEAYFIIIGDFNLTCETTADRDYVQMVKPFLDAGYNVANCSTDANIAYRYPDTTNLGYEMPSPPTDGFVYTYTGSSASTNDGNWYAHDNVVTSGNIEIVKTEVDLTKTAASATNVKLDHFPVISYLTVYG